MAGLSLSCQRSIREDGLRANTGEEPGAPEEGGEEGKRGPCPHFFSKSLGPRTDCEGEGGPDIKVLELIKLAWHSHFRVFIQRKWKQDLEEIFAPWCSLQHFHNSQAMETTQVSVNRWMDKIEEYIYILLLHLSIHLYIMTYYSAMRKKEIPPFSTTWMDSEVIMIRYARQERQTLHGIIYRWTFFKVERIEKE